MGFRYILAVLVVTAFFVTGCSSGADNSGRYFDENGEVIDNTQFDPTFGADLNEQGSVTNDAENMMNDAENKVREMGDSIKDTVDDMTDGNTGRNTVEGTNPASDGYISPQMTGVNGAGDYRDNTTGMAGTSQTVSNY